MRKGQQPPWIVSDGLWQRIEPLLPKRVVRDPRRPGRNRLDDRKVLCGTLFVLHTGIQWKYLPQELGFGSGMTCWRRLDEWNRAGVWQRLHELMLAELQGAADRAYDHDKYRRLVHGKGIRTRIARRGQPDGSGLGKVRWVVERTIAWYHGMRRLRIRWERRNDVYEAFLALVTCIITYRHVTQLCQRLLPAYRTRGRGHAIGYLQGVLNVLGLDRHIRLTRPVAGTRQRRQT